MREYAEFNLTAYWNPSIWEGKTTGIGREYLTNLFILAGQPNTWEEMVHNLQFFYTLDDALKDVILSSTAGVIAGHKSSILNKMKIPDAKKSLVESVTRISPYVEQEIFIDMVSEIYKKMKEKVFKDNKTDELFIYQIVESIQTLYEYKLDRYFSSELFLQNIEILNKLFRLFKSFGLATDEYIRNTFYPITEIDFQFIEEIIKDLRSIKDRRIYMYNTLLSSLNLVISRLDSFTNRDIVPLSALHSGEFSLMMSLERKGLNLSDIVTVCFDRHNDVEDQDGIYNSSFYGKLLQRGLGGLVIIGLDSSYKNMYETDNPEEHGKVHDYSREYMKRYLKNWKFYQQNKSKISLITLSDIVNLSGEIDFELFENLLETSLQKYSDQGKILFPSVDIDCLSLWNERITSTKYNPFNAIFALGLQNLNEFLEKLKLTQEQLDRFYHDSISSPLDARTKRRFAYVLKKLELTIDYYLFPSNDALFVSRTMTRRTGPSGFTLKELINLLGLTNKLANKLTFKKGIPYNNNTVWGIISEYSESEYGENARYAIEQIRKALLNFKR